MREEHNWYQKIWWWCITIGSLPFNYSFFKGRLKERKECINNCKIRR